MNIIKVLTTACILVSSFAAQAQDKITYTDIAYAVFCLKKSMSTSSLVPVNTIAPG